MPLNDYAPIIPWVGTVVAVLYAICVTCKACKKGGSGTINKDKQKDCPKVVHTFDIEDLGDKTCYCRCWKSAKFPYCDGSHTKHNKECGDNVGPVVLKRKDA